MNARSTDYDIRAATVDRLLSEGVSRDCIRHEIPLGSFSENGRTDIVVLTDRLLGFEIKSGRDKLTRLKQQLSSYARHLDFAGAIIDETQESKLGYVANTVIYWRHDDRAFQWGQLGSAHFSKPALFRLSDETSPGAMAELLWRDEAVEVAFRLGQGFKTRRAALAWIRENACLKTLRPLVLEQIKSRVLNGQEETFWKRFDAIEAAA